jgi:hypothetical protein
VCKREKEEGASEEKVEVLMFEDKEMCWIASLWHIMGPWEALSPL